MVDFEIVIVHMMLVVFEIQAGLKNTLPQNMVCAVKLGLAEHIDKSSIFVELPLQY